jgi:hypothetical protein
MELKVLFIEDNLKLGESLRKNFNGEIISGFNINAEVVGVFEDGLKSILKNDYDIVILDLYKDGKTKDEEAGIKVLDQIRAHAFIPVIFYTGHAYKITDLVSEIVGVVSKGDGIEALKEEIERIITSKIALIKGQIYSHLKEFLRKYFWETVDTEKEIFNPRKNDVSLGYLLLRRFANSLSKENIKELLGDTRINADKTHPMEFYIFPTNSGEYEAGEIIFKDGIYFAILTPSCDFIEEGKRHRKVGNVLLAEATRLIDSDFYKKYVNNKAKYEQSLSELIESRKGDRFFFLPGTPFIENLFLDFQNKQMVSYNDLGAFKRVTKLDAPFAQSMISSFIRYYNRIGFQDIDSNYIIQNL